MSWAVFELKLATGPVNAEIGWCIDLNSNQSYGGYEPRLRGWYKHTKAAGTNGWGGGPYAISTTGDLVVRLPVDDL